MARAFHSLQASWQKAPMEHFLIRVLSLCLARLYSVTLETSQVKAPGVPSGG